jgi:hypothetical protein
MAAPYAVLFRSRRESPLTDPQMQLGRDSDACSAVLAQMDAAGSSAATRSAGPRQAAQASRPAGLVGPALSHREARRGPITASLGRLLTGAAVGPLAQQVDMPKVACSLLDQVQQDPAQRHVPLGRDGIE